MRRFIVLGHGVATTPGFSLDDLPGAGRLDVLCRCVSAGLLLSHGIREGTRVDLVLDDAFTVRFDGATVRHLHPDERNVAARIQGALEQRDGAVGRVPVETSPGVRLVRAGVEATLADAAEAGSLIRLAALCGGCGARLSVRRYLDADDACPDCGLGFNPGCAAHRDRYFAVERSPPDGEGEQGFRNC